jgi:hypothetical protein
MSNNPKKIKINDELKIEIQKSTTCLNSFKPKIQRNTLKSLKNLKALTEHLSYMNDTENNSLLVNKLRKFL